MLYSDYTIRGACSMQQQTKLLAKGTAGLLGNGFIDDEFKNFSEVVVTIGQTISLSPMTYGYIGGVENGSVRKTMLYFPPVNELEHNDGFFTTSNPGISTNMVLLLPKYQYTITRLQDEEGLACYEVIES